MGDLEQNVLFRCVLHGWSCYGHRCPACLTRANYTVAVQQGYIAKRLRAIHG